ncbi:hypothetical protein ZIOFF_052784 [Zingiber officinale]|uniref:Uncharacterized protein n=1 Tax=Zingiber officinale TaxID=94328 RepID=A0A8J5FV98_ZINOF|nr:hypothetical protein ZIOFF_052784 [Zingiber officinale]
MASSSQWGASLTTLGPIDTLSALVPVLRSLSIVLEYIDADVLELAKNDARVIPKHIQLLMKNNEEFGRLLACATISNDGSCPTSIGLYCPRSKAEGRASFAGTDEASGASLLLSSTSFPPASSLPCHHQEEGVFFYATRLAHELLPADRRRGLCLRSPAEACSYSSPPLSLVIITASSSPYVGCCFLSPLAIATAAPPGKS